MSNQSSEITICRSTDTDIPSIIRINNASFSKNNVYDPDVFNYLYQDSAYHFVAVNFIGEIIGYILSIYLEYEQRMGEFMNARKDGVLTICSIAVDPSERHKKVADRLLGRFIADITKEEQNIKSLMLQVRISNKHAIHLYEKHGFKRDKSLMINYYSDPTEDAYLMYLDLNNYISIRKARLIDINGIAEGESLCFGEEAYSHDIIKSVIENSEYNYVAVSPSGNIVGYIMSSYIHLGEEDESHIMEKYINSCNESRLLELSSIGVIPAMRNQQVGKKLMSYLLNDLSTKSDSNKRITLRVRTKNDIAIKLYEGFNFIKYSETIKDYYCNPVDDAYIMYRCV